jgi:ligand-binding sensor domain-containing protein
VGYFDRGLDVWDPATGRVSHFEDEHLFCVNRIALRKDGAAVATANGLVLADREGKTRQVLTRSEGLIANHATDVLLDETGMVVATPAGITFLTSSGTFSIYAFHGLVNNHVYALAAAGGRIFAGTLGGLSVLEGGTVKASYTTANSLLRHNWISAATAAGDQIFAGTYGAGVYRFDGATWHGFPDLREGFEVNPNSMAATEGAVFAGTLTRGLAIYNRANGRWNFFTSGLPSGNVTAVAAGSGNLYIGTDNGLVRMAEGSVRLP